MLNSINFKDKTTISYCKDLKILFSSYKERSASLLDQFIYISNKNHSSNIIFDLEKTSEKIGRSKRMIYYYLKELQKAGCICWKKIKGKTKKYIVSLSDKILSFLEYDWYKEEEITETINTPCMNIKEDESPTFLESVKSLNTDLAIPLCIDDRYFEKSIATRIERKFGPDKKGRLNFSAYCSAIKQNLLLLGKKTMRDGKKFKMSMGSLVSDWLIDSYEKKNSYFKYENPSLNTLKDSYKKERLEEERQQQESYVQEVIAMATSEADKFVKEKLCNLIGKEAYKSWFAMHGFHVIEKEGKLVTRFTKETLTPFVKDHINTHYRRDIDKVIELYHQNNSKE